MWWEQGDFSCQWESPATSQGVTDIFWERARREREPLRQPVGAAFCLGWRGGNREPLGMPGPQPVPNCSMGCSHMVQGLAPTPHTGRELAKWGMMWWSRQAAGHSEDAPDPCLMSAPAAALTSPWLIPTAHPHLRVPVPSPAATVASQKEEVSPPASLHHHPRLFWVWRKAEGSTGPAMPCSKLGPVVDGERGTPTSLHTPVPTCGMRKEDLSHLKHKRFWGAQKGGLGSSQGDCRRSSNVSSSQFLPFVTQGQGAGEHAIFQCWFLLLSVWFATSAQVNVSLCGCMCG